MSLSPNQGLDSLLETKVYPLVMDIWPQMVREEALNPAFSLQTSSPGGKGWKGGGLR